MMANGNTSNFAAEGSNQGAARAPVQADAAAALVAADAADAAVVAADGAPVLLAAAAAPAPSVADMLDDPKEKKGEAREAAEDEELVELAMVSSGDAQMAQVFAAAQSGSAETTADYDDGEGGGQALTYALVGGAVLGGILVVASGGDDDNEVVAPPPPPPPPPPPANQPPTTDATRALTTDEDTAATFTVTATDPNNDTLTFTASDPANGTVTGGANGVFTYTPDANFNGTDTFTITVSDGKGGTVTQTVTVTVTPVNDIPTLTVVATAVDVAENTDADTVVLSPTAVDVDEGDTLTFSLEGDDADLFTIDPETGEVRFIDSPDFEDPQDADGDNVYNVTVVVTDAAGGRAEQDVTITVTDQFQVQSLDEDDDGDLTTARVFDAGTNEFQFTDDAAVANNAVITNFGADDFITFDADADDVSFANLGDADGNGLGDLQITINVNGTATTLILEDAVLDPDALVFDEASAEAAVAGEDSFRFGDVVAPPGPPLPPPTVSSLDVDDDNDPTTLFEIDASGDNFAFTDDDDVANGVVITNFAEGDTIVSDATSVSFTSRDAEGDGIGNDVEITINKAGGIVSQIILLDAVAEDAFVFDEASAEAAVGHDFFQFA